MATESENAQRYSELADLQVKMLNSRRQVEWKINFGVWTGIAAIAYFLFMARNQLESWAIPAFIVLSILSALVFALHVFSTSGSNRKDIDLFNYFRANALKCMGDQNGQEHLKWPQHLNYSPIIYAFLKTNVLASMAVPLCLTAVLVVGSISLLCIKTPQSEVEKLREDNVKISRTIELYQLRDDNAKLKQALNDLEAKLKVVPQPQPAVSPTSSAAPSTVPSPAPSPTAKLTP